MTRNSKLELSARPIWIQAGYCALWALVAINAVSIFGYATFTLNPELLARYPWAAKIFGYTYAWFARVQIALAFVCLACMLTAFAQRRWWKALAGVFALSLLAETVGVAFGFPFGPYEYTDLLGPKILGVPFLIPISWFFMAVACYRIALHLEAGIPSPWWRCFAAAFLLSAWDLTLDPAMSKLSPFWVWGVEGGYYGSPWINLFGWFVTGLFIMAFFEATRSRQWIHTLPMGFGYAFYGVNLMLPVGLVIASGLWGPVGISAVTFLLLWSIAKARTLVFGNPAKPGEARA